MLTSRTWIISSGLVGALSLMLRSVLNFSFTGAIISLPTLNPLFIINGIIFAVAASASLFGHGSDSSTTKYQHKEHHGDDDDAYRYDEHDHVPSSENSSSSSFDQYKNKVHREEEKFPVRSESKGSYPDVRFPSTTPEKTFGLRRPPIAPVKTFPQDDKSTDEGETMEEMWNRVKSEKQLKKPNSSKSHVISRQNSKMSTSSLPSPSLSPLPSPSRARRYQPSWAPSPSRTRKSPPSGMKLMERVPSWVKLKKELSMGREELNSRVEAFIEKFKDEMKLQRSESLRRYKLFRRSSEEK